MVSLFISLHVFLYRTSRGKIGGTFRGAPVLLLTTIGRKSGRSRTTPLLFIRESENFVLVASNGGKDNDPSWWNNLKKNPKAEILLGANATSVVARGATTEEKTRYWQKLVQMYNGYGEYQKKTPVKFLW